MYTAPEMAARERELNSIYVIAAIIIVVIVTITFGALIFTFFWRSQNGYLWGHIQIPWLLWITTAILLASSFTLERARRCWSESDRRGFSRFLQWTGALGLVFLAGQIAAWFQVLNSEVVLDIDKHSWFIFLFSGLHAIHILGGLAAIGYILYRAKQPASGPRYHMTTRGYTSAFTIYWHYMGFIWVVLFVLLLTWRR